MKRTRFVVVVAAKSRKDEREDESAFMWVSNRARGVHLMYVSAACFITKVNIGAMACICML